MHGNFSQDSWTQFIYTRCQNTNRKSSSSNSAPAPKKAKLGSTDRHSYASVSVPDDDEEAYKRNVSILKQEVLKPKAQTEVVKNLVRRTFSGRRTHILEDQPSVESLVDTFPHLKKTNYVSIIHAGVYLGRKFEGET